MRQYAQLGAAVVDRVSKIATWRKRFRSLGAFCHGQLAPWAALSILAQILNTSPIQATDQPDGSQQSAKRALELIAAAEYGAAASHLLETSKQRELTGEECYLVGFSLYKRDRLIEASRYIELARDKQFKAYPDWTSTERLLERLSTLKKLRPPLAHEFKSDDGKSLRVFYDEHRGSTLYLRLMSIALYAAGKDLFGNDNPSVDLVLLGSTLAYRDYIDALDMRIPETSRAAHSGLGVAGLAVYRLHQSSCADEDCSLPAGTLRSIAHEFGHAATLGCCEGGQVTWPEWYTEGLAMFVQWKVYSAGRDRAKLDIRELGEREDPEEFQAFVRSFRDKREKANYAIAGMMIEECMRHAGPENTPLSSLIRRSCGSLSCEEAVAKCCDVTLSELYWRVRRGDPK